MNGGSRARLVHLAQHLRQQLASGERNRVVLHRTRAGRGSRGARIQQRMDAPGPVGRGVAMTEAIGIVRPDDRMVGVYDAPVRGVEEAGQRVVGNEPGPVVFSRPSRHRVTPVAGAPDRHPPRGDDPDIAAGIGIDRVLMRGVEEGERRVEFFPIPRPVEPPDRLAGHVVLAQRRGGERDHMARLRDAPGLAVNIRDHRSVPGRPHHQRHVVPAPDPDPFDANPERARPVGGEIAVRIVGIDPLHKQVLGVAVGRRQAPGDRPVMAENRHRNARDGRAGEREARGFDPRQVPQPRRAKTEMGIVGEDRAAGLGMRSRDRPDVGGGDRSDLLGPAREKRREQRRPAERRDGRRRRAGDVGPELVDPLGREQVGEPGAQGLGPRIGRQPHPHKPRPDQRIRRAPFLRRRKHEREFDGDQPGMGAQIGVDPVGIGFEAVDHRRGEPFQRSFGEAVETEDAHPPVERQCRCADDLRQPPGAGPAHELHLKETVLSMYEAQGKIGVPFARRDDARDAVAVAQDRNRRIEPGERDRSLGLRARRLDRQIRAADDDNHKNRKPGRDPPQPGPETVAPSTPHRSS